MRSASKLKEVYWIAGAREDLRRFPEAIRLTMGYALYLAQAGDKHTDAKPLRGFGGAGVLEVVEDYDGDTYRAVYTVRLKDAIYVLHAFQKKSKKGGTTPQQDINLIKERLQKAAKHYSESRRTSEEK